jgi:phosphoribosylglycinamide formyltransferase-1
MRGVRVTQKVGVGVLVSGSGTNLQAILDAQKSGALGPGEVRVVISNVEGVQALERAARAGVAAHALPHKRFPSREAYDAQLVQLLREARVDWVVLAGFMRLVTATLLDAFPMRVLNIHPSLLPAFPGLRAVRQALDHGAKVTGVSVHLVDAGLDAGPIVAQVAVPVLDADDEDTLSARIHAEEHRLYPAVVRAAVEGRLSVHGRRVVVRSA